ncbi:MAG: glucokinase [Planctomycetota bacterium]|jgi:glucokinase
MNILAADIGGTNSRFAHFVEDQNGRLSVVETMWFKTTDFLSFNQLIEKLNTSTFSLKPGDAHGVVIAIAGPVERGVYSSPPFISWDIDITRVQKDYDLKKCYLINDFVAQAFACRSPIGETAEKILDGRVDPDEPSVVLGAGTALGMADLVPDGSGGFVALASEGGHTNFPFVSTREYEFQHFLLKETGEEYITANYVVSGKGISYIHRFLTGERLGPQEVTSKFNDDSETLAWAARFYGRTCRNYALNILARGGVYIAGGVAARTPELLTHSAFKNEFYQSHTMVAILNEIPVFLIRNEESGLWGAAFYGLQKLRKS